MCRLLFGPAPGPLSAWGRHWPSGRARLRPQPTCSTPQPRRAFPWGRGSAPGLSACGASGASAGAASPRSRHDAPLRLPLPPLVGMLTALTPRPPRAPPWLGAPGFSVSVGLVPLPPPGLCQLGLLLPSCLTWAPLHFRSRLLPSFGLSLCSSVPSSTQAVCLLCAVSLPLQSAVQGSRDFFSYHSP